MLNPCFSGLDGAWALGSKFINNSNTEQGKEDAAG